MERNRRFMSSKIQFCKASSKLIYNQCNQNPNFIKTDILKVIWKCKGPRIPKTHLKRKNKTKELPKPELSPLKSYSNQDNMILASKYKNKSMKQDGQSRNGFTHTWKTDF